jgi:hypothetical protein
MRGTLTRSASGLGLVEAVRVGVPGFGADAAGLLAVDGVMSADVTCSGVALAMLANLEEWGGYCGRVAGALVARYGLAGRAVGFFRFFAEPAPGLAEQARSVVAAGLAAGEDPQEAVRAARALHAYEIAFWDTLADGLG